jgi:uncharacterized caspase-like protein
MSTRFNSIAGISRVLDLRVAAVGSSVSRAIAARALALRAVLSCVLICVSVCLLASDPAFAGRRVALVIGNSAYRNAGVLPNTSNDAKAIAALFTDAGFDFVDLRQDLGVLDFKRAVRGFMSQAGTADIAVVYYAGHGIESGGINYLIPIDAKLATDYDAEDETVSLERVIAALQPAHQLRLIILDACRDNPFNRNIQRTVSLRAFAPGLSRVEPTTTDTLVAFAAKAGSFSLDGNGPNSPFTTALLKHISEPGLDIRIALGRVRDEVLRTTANNQEPFVYGSLGGKTISLVPAAESKKPEPQPPALDSNDASARDYQMAERVGTQKAWESFLSLHKSGFYADLARAQLTKQSTVAIEAAKPPAADLSARDKATREKAEKALADKALADKEKAEQQKVAKAEADPEVVSHAQLCKRDAETLGRLRANPARDEVERFSRDLKCIELRAQVARLLESVNPSQSLPPQVTGPRDQGPADGVDRPAHEAPAPRESRVDDPRGIETNADRTSDEPSCKRDRDKLVALRANPVRDDVARFARDLHCETLRAQVTRLLESLGD